MQFHPTPVHGVWRITQFSAEDARGVFVKTFHRSRFQEAGIDFTCRESFYSVSVKDVIRGLHFQHPPHDHAKIVFCPSGAILDLALDIRLGSPTYGQSVSAELSAANREALYIPPGFAHGFRALTNDALTYYLVSSENHPPSDDGIRFDSIGFNWGTAQPVVSARDLAFPALSEFISPFVYLPS
jgi:dTDP-4-dehydrorhamnose 3,5-epimerase